MDSLNETQEKGHNLTATGSSEPVENCVSCELEFPGSPSSEPTCKKRCVNALLHSSMERMRRERIKDCCDQLRVLLPYVKGRRTDVASILEMTVEYMRYIYGRIPNNVMSQIIEIFQTNTRYCKYVWKPNDHKYPQKQLTQRTGSLPRKDVFTGDSSEKVKPKVQFAPYQCTGNEYFNNQKTDAAGPMNCTIEHQKAAFESNQYCIPATERLVPQFQTNTLSPNIPPLSPFSIPYDVQNICPPNLANISIFPSTYCPSGSLPMFTVSNGRPWSSDITRPCIGPSSLLSSNDCLSSLSSLPSGYFINSYPIISTSAVQTIGRNFQLCTVNTSSSSVMPFTGTNHGPTNFSAVHPAKPHTTVWTTNGEGPGPEGTANVCNIIDQNSSAREINLPSVTSI